MRLKDTKFYAINSSGRQKIPGSDLKEAIRYIHDSDYYKGKNTILYLKKVKEVTYGENEVYDLMDMYDFDGAWAEEHHRIYHSEDFGIDM